MDDKVYSYFMDSARRHIDDNVKKQNTIIEIGKKDTFLEEFIAGQISTYNDFAAPNLKWQLIDGKMIVSEVVR